LGPSGFFGFDAFKQDGCGFVVGVLRDELAAVLRPLRVDDIDFVADIDAIGDRLPGGLALIRHCLETSSPVAG